MAESTTAVLVEHGTPSTTPDADLIRLAGGFIAGKRSPDTRDAYGDDLRMFFRWCRAHDIDPIIGIRRTHLELYARHMEDRGLAPSTRQRRIGTVRGWYDWLIDEAYFDQPNPVRKVKQPNPTPVTDRAVLTKREMHILFKAAEEDGPCSWAMVALGYVNGLRIGEATATNIADVGKHGWHHTLRIRGKGEKYDEVALPPAAYAAVSAATAGRDVGPILLSPTTGKRMRRRQAANVLTRLCKKHDLTRITPHGLRRTAITLLLQDGVPLRDVQLFARHANPRTTAGYDRRARSLDEHLGNTLVRVIA
jgi:integrase/recombinase XerD